MFQVGENVPLKEKQTSSNVAFDLMQVVPCPEVGRQSPPQDAVFCGPQEISGG